MMELTIFWFRRDLRLRDNTALYHALKENSRVLPIFIFDRNILDGLEEKRDRRVEFIHKALMDIQRELVDMGSTLEVYFGYPLEIFKRLFSTYKIKKVYANHDYEPYARERDLKVAELLQEAGAEFHTYKDQVIFEKNEVVKDDGLPYTVFTPYSKKWRLLANDRHYASWDNEAYFSNFYKQPVKDVPALPALGFLGSGLPFPPGAIRNEVLQHYHVKRDYPGYPDGTSRLGVHLRFGTCSIRELARKAVKLNDTYLTELIWREFYQMILWHFPMVGQGRSFKPSYDLIGWRNNEDEFGRWRRGETGYPIVDAGMRELNTTGYMHNRVRMIVASFLTKHLLIDWRWGEAYFAEKLLDFDLAANNGGWQWAAGSGCDAAPYFRVFNPYLQTEKFDPMLKYVRQWVPEWEDPGYPAPIVEHETARKRALEVYGKALKDPR